MNDEILSGLKNARERGFSLEESVQSFLNAGYNPAEVKEAASFLSKGFSPLPMTLKETTVSSTPKSEEEQKPKSSRMKWIIIILIALVIVALTISLLFFKDIFLGIIDSISV